MTFISMIEERALLLDNSEDQWKVFQRDVSPRKVRDDSSKKCAIYQHSRWF